MISLTAIKNIVESETGVKLSGKKKTREIADARSIYCFLSRFETRKTIKEIGNIIKKNHTTVWYNVEKCKRLIELEPFFYEKYNSCKQALNDYKTNKQQKKCH